MCEYSFDPIETRDKIVEGIRNMGISKAVVGISGGKDSAVTAALCVRALGKDNVYGVMLPDGEQTDIEDAQNICRILDIPHITINIAEIHKRMLLDLKIADQFLGKNGMKIPFDEEANINVPPRIRMTILRYITQTLGARLAGTGNLSEITVGYCTKDGDTSCDFSVLGGLTSIEVVQVGLTMKEIPEALVLKAPADGLSGKTDEERLGISYEDIHHYLRGDAEINKDVRSKIVNLAIKNMHKRTPPELAYDPFWLTA